MVSFATAVKNGFKKTADFSSRATRAEYWWWVLFRTLFWLAAIGICALLKNEVLTIVLMYICLLLLIPSLPLAVRRMHDIGHSGWTLLLMRLLPYVGEVIILVYLCRQSAPDNKYGPNPNNV